MKIRHVIAACIALPALSIAGGAAPRGIEPLAASPKSGTRLEYPNADIERVAKTWERLLGDTVTIAERARTRRITMRISATSREELRTKMEAALRENGIYVIPRAEGVLFDIEPATPPAK